MPMPTMPPPPSTLQLLRRFSALLKRERVLFAALTGTMSLLALMQLPAPLLTMYAIDAINGARGSLPPSVPWLCGGLVAALIVSRVAHVAQRFWLEKFRYRLVFSLQRSLFAHVLRLPLAQHVRVSHGYWMARIQEDPQRVQGLMADSILSMVSDLLTLLVGTVFLFHLHWKMALLAVSVLPVLAVLFLRVRTSLRGEFRESQERSAQVSRVLAENLAGARTVKVLALESAVGRRFVRLSVESIRQRFRILRRRLVYENAIGLLTGIVPIALLGFGAVEIVHGRLSLGGFVAFSGYLAYLFRPAEGLVITLLALQGSLAAVERIFGVLDLEPETDAAGRIHRFAARVRRPPAVELCRVGFRYGPDRPWLFRDVDLTVAPGELVAIQGPSGVGKSTLLNLLPRLLRPVEGTVRVDGFDVDAYRLRDLRRRVVVVSLETQLFAATVTGNLTLGLRGVTRAEIEEVLAIAEADEFVAALPEGFDTVLGDTGFDLSAGQRQRLLLARALLRRPSVLVLDEATAFLDSRLERQVLENLRFRRPELTLLCVSHRSAAADLADRSLEIAGGGLFPLAAGAGPLPAIALVTPAAGPA